MTDGGIIEDEEACLDWNSDKLSITGEGTGRTRMSGYRRLVGYG